MRSAECRQKPLFESPCRAPGCHRRGGYRRGLCDQCYADPELRGRHAIPDRRPQAKPCNHCKVEKSINRPRGLCWECYYTPGVKDQYPASKHSGAYRGLGLDYKAGPLPEPTAALPGTFEKLEVLRLRVLAGEQLWHPLDRRLGDADTTAGEAAALLLSHGW